MNEQILNIFREAYKEEDIPVFNRGIIFYLANAIKLRLDQYMKRLDISRQMNEDQLIELIGHISLEFVSNNREFISYVIPKGTSNNILKDIFFSLHINMIAEFVITSWEYSPEIKGDVYAEHLEKIVVYSNSFRAGMCFHVNFRLYRKLTVYNIEDKHLICSYSGSKTHMFVFIGSVEGANTLYQLKTKTGYILDLWYCLVYPTSDLFKDAEHMESYAQYSLFICDRYEQILASDLRFKNLNNIIAFADTMANAHVGLISAANPRSEYIYNPIILDKISQYGGHFDIKDPLDHRRTFNYIKTLSPK